MGEVLEWLCPQKSLYYQELTRDAASELLQGVSGVSSRVVLASFSLNETEWRRFTSFFQSEPNGILQRHHLNGPSFEEEEDEEGHAVVITGESNDAWLIKNSWGEDFADAGYFRVAKDAFEFTFHDVCFRTCDLHRAEIKAYRLAPSQLDVDIVPRRSQMNPVSSLGWEIDFETLRIERVRKRNCSVALWNRENPFRRIQPGYQIISVNHFDDKNDIISELQRAPTLRIRLTIMSTIVKLDDLVDASARQFSYAHTIAASIRETQGRIFARGIELHDDIVDGLVMTWGAENINMDDVLLEACNQRGLHYSLLTVDDAMREVLRPGGRNLIARFGLDAAAWGRFDQFFAKFADDQVLWSRHVGNNRHLPQQFAYVLVCGAGESHDGRGYWKIRDPLGSSNMLYVGMNALEFSDFYDMFFYMSDLSSKEIRLFNAAPPTVEVFVERPRSWVKGVKSLGLSINEETLQIEWIDAWSPIMAYNEQVDELKRVYPGHFICEVDGHTDKVSMLDKLDNAFTMNIMVAHVLRDGPYRHSQKNKIPTCINM